MRKIAIGQMDLVEIAFFEIVSRGYDIEVDLVQLAFAEGRFTDCNFMDDTVANKGVCQIGVIELSACQVRIDELHFCEVRILQPVLVKLFRYVVNQRRTVHYFLLPCIEIPERKSLNI
jgi:DNA primase